MRTVQLPAGENERDEIDEQIKGYYKRYSRERERMRIIKNETLSR